MLLKGWLLVVVAMAIAVICMMFIKDGENKSVKRCYLERMVAWCFSPSRSASSYISFRLRSLSTMTRPVMK